MNGKIKFHKATGPAFNEGEVWIDSSGFAVEIVSIRHYPGAIAYHTSDFAVTYVNDCRVLNEKDAWNFQVRYTHQADVTC